MLRKEEISNSLNGVTFMVPQVGREIPLHLGWLADLDQDFGAKHTPVLREKPEVYPIGDKFGEINKGDGTVIYFQAINDVIIYRKYIFFFSYNDVYYGYTRLNRSECDQYLATTLTERIQPAFLGKTQWFVLKTPENRFLLINPHADGYGHGSLFNSYEDLELDNAAVKEFIAQA